MNWIWPERFHLGSKPAKSVLPDWSMPMVLPFPVDCVHCQVTSSFQARLPGAVPGSHYCTQRVLSSCLSLSGSIHASELCIFHRLACNRGLVLQGTHYSWGLVNSVSLSCFHRLRTRRTQCKYVSRSCHFKSRFQFYQWWGTRFGQVPLGCWNCVRSRLWCPHLNWCSRSTIALPSLSLPSAK